MKNNHAYPHFYREKKTSFTKVFLIIAATLLVFLLWAMQVPKLRQRIIEPLYATGSFCQKSVHWAVERLKVNDGQPGEAEVLQSYEPVSLPDREVLFAEEISDLTVEDPLAEYRVTPMPEDGIRAAEWVYLDEFTAKTEGVGLSAGTESFLASPPVFEHADLFNDGPAALSALLRFHGITTHQYQISEKIHPEMKSVNVSMDALERYVAETCPDYRTVVRMNGTFGILKDLLVAGYPAIVRIQKKSPVSFYQEDDRLMGDYVLVLGFETRPCGTELCEYAICQDPKGSGNVTVPVQDFLAAWYPFQRSYLVIYPGEAEESISSILAEDWNREINLQNALTKFRTDAEFLPDDPYAHYNYGKALFLSKEIEDAREEMRKAEANGLMQRTDLYDTAFLETLFALGEADALEVRCRAGLQIDSHSLSMLLWIGWADILRGETDKAAESFHSAARIDPNDPDVLYALKYIE